MERHRCHCDSYKSYESYECKKVNMYKTIGRECNLTSLHRAINKAGLRETIANTQNITVFGPTNRAFCKFNKGSGCGELASVLAYHVVPERLPSSELENDKTYPTLRGNDKIRVNIYNRPIFRDVVSVNGAEVKETDIKASNGILHKIDQVLCPPTGSILEIAVSDPDNFSVLVDLALAADPIIVEALGNPDANLTLFAPTNQAFQILADDLGITLSQLCDALKAAPELLTQVLLYHVLGQTVFSIALKKGLTYDIPTLSSLEPNTINIITRCRGRKIYIEDLEKRIAKVVIPNVLATNGVIHVIDRVLLPLIPDL